MNRPCFNHLGWQPSGVVADPNVLGYQQILAFLNFLPNTPRDLDGVVGDRTRSAVEAYQRSTRLPVTRSLDRATKASLDTRRDQADGAGFIRPMTPVRSTSTTTRTTTQTQIATSTPAATPVASTGSKVVGTQPEVTSIVTKGSAAGPAETVVVPQSVSKMISPETAQQLSNMPASQVKSFVDQLEERASVEASTATEDVALNAVPVVDSAGRVALGVNRTPAGLWDTLSGGQKAAVIGGGAVVGLGIIALVVVVASGPRSNPPKRRRRRR